MITFGKISEIGTDGRAKVDLVGEDLKTGWLHLLVTKSMEDQTGFPLDVGETVAIMTDRACEDGVILGAIYTKTDQPTLDPEQYGLKVSNGDEFIYDRDQQLMNIKLKLAELSIEDSNLELSVQSEARIAEQTGAESGVNSGKVILKGAEPIVSILVDLVTWATSHTHICGGSGSPSAPPLQAGALSPISTRFTQSMEQ